MRLIDVDKLPNYLCEVNGSVGTKEIVPTEFRFVFWEDIKKAPTIDAVEVVRCKDCAHRHSSEFCECRPDDFHCADGERNGAE